MEKSAIAEFYKGRSVFITGATGFIGKALVEKLLRSCPDVKCVYLLMRPSNGKTVECRLQELIENQIFDNVRNQQPDAMKKVVSIEGDITLPGFGISPDDLGLLIENVSVVFNSAATVKFNEELKTAIDMNVKGPLELLEMCRQMKRLEALVHVSTAYNNLHREVMKEEVIHSTTNPIKLIDIVNCLKENVINKITKEIIGNCPNTYTYTKGLAEQLLEQRCDGLPLAIVRPSIVTAALNEPVPGWVDNWNGPTGVIASIGTGFLRILKANEDMVADIIPIDFVINLMITVGMHTAIKRPNQVIVYSSTTSQHNPLPMKSSVKFITDSWLKFPSNRMIWYPSLTMSTNDIAVYICKILFHYLSAILLDFSFIVKRKPMKWVRLYGKAHRIFASYEYFRTHQWRFLSNNPIRLLDEMSPQDRKTFYFDVRQIEWQSYFETYILGVRRFILKEDPKTLPLAEIKLNRLYVVRLFLYALLFFSLIYFCKHFIFGICFIGIIFIASRFTTLTNNGRIKQTRPTSK